MPGKHLVQATAPFRIRNFSLLWVSQTISLVGDQCYSIAFIWLLVNLTHSPVLIGTVMSLGYVPMILLLIVGGIWADHIDPRRIVLWSDILRLSIAAVITILATLGYLSLSILFIVVIISSLVGSFFVPALSSLFLSCIPPKDINASNALFQVGRESAALLGPALGGYLIAKWSLSAAFAFDAITYGVSVIMIACIRQDKERVKQDTSTKTESEKSLSNTIVEFTAGFRFLWKERGMLAIVTLFAITNALNNVEAVLVPILARFSLKLPAEQFGLIASCYSVGSLSGAVIMNLWGIRMRHYALVICISMMVFGAAIISMGFSQQEWQLYIAYFFFGFSYIFTELASATLWLHLVPADLRGRVFSVMSTLAMGLNPAGLLLAGILGNTFGVREGIWIGGAAVALLGIVTILRPSIWNLDQRVKLLLSNQ